MVFGNKLEHEGGIEFVCCSLDICGIMNEDVVDDDFYIV